MLGRRQNRPALGPEPLEGRQLLSGLLVALQSNVPILTPAEVTSIATTRAHSASSQASALAATGGGSSSNSPMGFKNVQAGVFTGNGSINNNGTPAGPNAAANFPVTALLGQGTPTQAELAREKFTAHFSGPLSTRPARFTDQSKILFLRGLGGSTPNFFIHGDYSLALVYPKGFSQQDPAGIASGAGPVTGFAFLDDKNNNSGGVVGLDLLADPTSFDAKGRPTRLTFTADANVYGGIFFGEQAAGTVSITYGKDGKSASTLFNGRIYTSGLTSPFENVDLYAKHSG